jgi:hypothetical protein
VIVIPAQFGELARQHFDGHRMGTHPTDRRGGVIRCGGRFRRDRRELAGGAALTGRVIERAGKQFVLLRISVQ